MPLTEKGRKILKNFKKEYGKEGESNFYASINAGKITGVEAGKHWAGKKRGKK